jgi:hypothetical protein
LIILYQPLRIQGLPVHLHNVALRTRHQPVIKQPDGRPPEEVRNHQKKNLTSVAAATSPASR